MLRNVTTVLVALLISAAPSARAQSSRPKFEVASVKPSAPGQQGLMEMQPNGRFVAYAVTVRNLLTTAYRIRIFQVVGGPSWIDTDRYDIEARAEEGSIPPPTGFPDPNAPGPIEIRIQSLLDNRFQLQVHRERESFRFMNCSLPKGVPR